MKKRCVVLVLLLCLLAASAAGILLCNDQLRMQAKEYFLYPECPAKPQRGKWYRITPEQALSADGSDWHGKIRFGNEDKLLIYLLGGGVVLDDFSASQSYAAVGSKAFYYDNDLGVSADRIQGGITSADAQNPFAEWTTFVIPYTTGDFHIGAGKAAVHHNGYQNFRALMNAVRSRLGEPEQLLIAGYSAGGFGAAMLAEDILEYFPQTACAAVCVDSALLLNDQWGAIARNLWHAPEHIASRIQTDNLTLDHLVALNAKYPEVKILFASSLRDGGLAKFQSYIDGGEYAATRGGGMRYFENLREMVLQMQKLLPDAAFYLWDDASGGAPTRHTMLYRDDFFAPLQEEMSMAQWILCSLSGEIRSCGLNLLQSLQ